MKQTNRQAWRVSVGRGVRSRPGSAKTGVLAADRKLLLSLPPIMSRAFVNQNKDNLIYFDLYYILVMDLLKLLTTPITSNLLQLLTTTVTSSFLVLSIFRFVH